MPVYEYYCDGCQHRFELMRPVSKFDEPAPCPSCGVPGQRRLSSFAFKEGQYGHFVKSSPPSGPSTEDGESSGK